MKVRNSDINEMIQAINMLDEGATDDGKKINFKFKSTTKYSQVKNLKKLKAAAADLEDTRQKMLKDYDLERSADEMNPQGKHYRPQDPVKLKEFNVEWFALMRAETEIALTPITEAEIDLEKNDLIPVRALSGLGPILKGFDDEKKPPA
jgi:hypothetical protein